MSATISKNDIKKAIAAVQLMIKYCERLNAKMISLPILRRNHLPILSKQLGALIPKLKEIDHLDDGRSLIYTPSKRAEVLQANLDSGYPHHTKTRDILEALKRDLEYLEAELTVITQKIT